MPLLLLLLACGPKVPPEGSTELPVDIGGVEPRVPAAPTPEPQVADGPLPLGTALPEASKDNAEAHAAFLAGEETLGRLLALEAPRGDAESRELAVQAVALVEEASGHFERAAELDPTLGAYCAARTGDAWRTLARRTAQMEPPIHSSPEDQMLFREERDATAAELQGHALAAYETVLASRTVDPRWRSHARWALTQLPQESP